jgi:hypothetical protein
MAENGNVNALVQSFSGADVAIIFGDHYIGEAMSFTVGVNREAGPLYVMGRKEPIAIPKGKRGVGGSFILAQLGFDALLEYYSSIRGSDTSKGIWIRKDEQMPITGERTAGMNQPKSSTITNGVNINTSTAAELWTDIGTPNYVDQMPPFNATIIGKNEQGYMMGFRVYGITIINEGIALSIEELNMEKRYTFIAQAVSRMTVLTN